MAPHYGAVCRGGAGLGKVSGVSTNEPSAPDSVLPSSGPGSPASWPRRFVALALDWVAANVAAFVIFGAQVWRPEDGWSWMPLVSWFVLVWLSTAFTGASLGQWMLRIRIFRLSGQRVGLVPAAIRTALILLVIPPLVADADKRGLHDLATNTAAVNGPQRST